MVSGAISLAVHGILMIGGGVLLSSPVEYGVEAGEGGLEVHLIAALPAARGDYLGAAGAASDMAVPTASAHPLTLDPLPSALEDAPRPTSSSVTHATPDVGDGSAPLPGRDAVTVHATGGARSHSGPGYIRNPAPAYPVLARQLGQAGTVILQAEVLPNGRCGQVSVQHSSGVALLDEAAFRAVARWQFKPARLAGRPVASWVEIPVTFRLVDADE
jgi:protein TonB